MSVYKNKRNPSDIQFLTTAKDIQVHTVRQLAKIPNKERYLLANEVASLAAQAHILLKEANSIHPKNRRLADERLNRLVDAYAKYQALISQIGVAEEFGKFTDTAMTKWMQLINEELRLIKALIASDEERYKNLT